MMKILVLLIATLMLILSAPVTGAISAQSPLELARNMDDVQSLGVIYINHNGSGERKASPVSETTEASLPPTTLMSGVSLAPRL